MVKKVIDIISSKTRAPSSGGGGEAYSKRPRLSSSLRSVNASLATQGNAKHSTSFSLWKKPVFILTAIFLIGTFSYAYFALPRAEIKIWPKTEVLTTETKLITIGKEIPGKDLEAIKRIDQKFFSSDWFLKEARAEGIIRLYNNYSTASQSLIPRTRFMSACGKKFRTPVRVVIPGKRREAGRWVSGTIDIKVIADQPGDEFNIGSTAFSIPGFAGLARFAAIYGRSYKPMTGGEIRDVVRVSQKDLNLAKDILTEKAAEGCLDILKVDQEFSILEEAIKIDILESFADVEVGTEKEKFTFQVKTKCRTIALKADDIKKFALNFITDKLPENQAIAPKSLKIDYSFENIDINQGEMSISLDLTANIYSIIDEFALREELIGKSLIETEVFLKNLLQINKVYVDFWPFWVESVPQNLDRVKIELKFDPSHVRM